jgi:hypothetical protein
MSDFLNKVVTIILIFIMLVLAPLLVSYKTNDMLGRRLILNDVTTFIDQVKDTATITEDDINKLYLDCNSHGLNVDVKIKRLIRTEITKEDVAMTTYFAVDNFSEISALNTGDVIQVHVEEVAFSTARRLTYTLLKIDEGPFEFTLAGAVG